MPTLEEKVNNKVTTVADDVSDLITAKKTGVVDPLAQDIYDGDVRAGNALTYFFSHKTQLIFVIILLLLVGGLYFFVTTQGTPVETLPETTVMN